MVGMESYTVQVDLAAPKPTMEQLDVLMEAVEAFAGTWGTTGGRVQVLLYVPGTTLRQAVTAAFAIVTDAVKQAGMGEPTVLGIEADLHGLRPSSGYLPALLSTTEVAQRLGISRQAVAKRAEKLGGKQVGETWVFSADRIEAVANAKAVGNPEP